VTVGREGRERKINKPLVWQTPSHKLKVAGKWRKNKVADGNKRAANNPPP
jgi:hypothetical protein